MLAYKDRGDRFYANERRRFSMATYPKEATIRINPLTLPVLYPCPTSKDKQDYHNKVY